MKDHFYFQTLLNTALNGLNHGGIPAAMRGIAGAILLATVLYQVYDAWWRDGDYRELGKVLVKAMVMTTLLAQWDPVFRLAVDAFNNVADTVFSHTAGGGDIVIGWLQDLSANWQTGGLQSIWNLVTGGAAAAINTLILSIVYLVLPIVYVIFSLAYVAVGTLLYGLGPLVLGLYPSGALGSYFRSYLKNLVTWGMWPVIYALFVDLMILVNMNSVNSVLNQKNFLGGFVGLGSALLLGIASVVFAIAIALIPLIAYYVIHGDIGQAVTQVAKTLMRNFKGPGGGG